MRKVMPMIGSMIWQESKRQTEIYKTYKGLYTLFSAISKLIGIPFGTMLLFAPEKVHNQ